MSVDTIEITAQVEKNGNWINPLREEMARVSDWPTFTSGQPNNSPTYQRTPANRRSARPSKNTDHKHTRRLP